MVRYFFFICLPRGFARWLGRPGLLEAECSLSHRASACPLECRDEAGGVKGFRDTLRVPDTYSASFICHFPSFFSLPLSYSLHEITFSLVSGERGEKKISASSHHECQFYQR